MKIIEISSLENGAHRNQEVYGSLPEILDGWAVIPEDMEIPNTYPFVDIEVSDGIVTSMSPREVPAAENEIVDEPTELEKMRADIDFIAAMGGIEL